MPSAQTLQGKTVALLNPRSGKKGKDEVEAALDRFFADGRLQGEVRRLGKGRSIADAARQAVDEGCACVIAAGGDGTISSVAEVLAGTDVALGVLPAGTFNYYARSLGISEDPAEALEVIATGRRARQDVGWINDRIFLNNASVGIYAVIRRQRERTYSHFGRSRIAAYWSVLQAMLRLYSPMDVRLTVDGREVRARSSLVFVCASPFQIEHFELDGADRVRNGDLALYMSRDRGRWGLIRMAFRLAVKGMERGRDFDLITGQEMEVATGRRYRHVVRDGETNRMRGPFRFRRDRGALTVLVPAGEAEVSGAAA